MNCTRCKTCLDPEPSPGSCIPRYGYDAEMRIHCWPCCARMTREHMQTHGAITLYVGSISAGVAHITDWTGLVTYSGSARSGKHNWHGVRRHDINFRDEHGYWWYGRYVHGPLSGQLCTFRMRAASASKQMSLGLPHRGAA